MTQAYYNGEFMPLTQIQVSPLDRGFLFGDGVYEVIPAYNRRLFRAMPHFERLARSLRELQIDCPQSTADWQQLCERLLEQNATKLGDDQAVYLQVTRGAAPLRHHFFPQGVEATVFAYSMALKVPNYSDLANYSGIAAITCDDQRWERCDIKSLNLLANAMANQKARQQGASEAILIRDGNAVEATAANLFVVKDRVIMTPPTQNILVGVTRACVLQLAEKLKIRYTEQVIPLPMLHEADEIWISSSTREIQPVVRLNQSLVGAGDAGPVWQALIQAYQEAKQEECACAGVG